MKQAVLGFALVLCAARCANVERNPDETSGSRPIPISAVDLKWVDLDPTGAPGVKIANLWGDPPKGRFGAFLKLPAGFAAPLHTHTHPMKVVVVSGSYLMQPGGNYRHTTSCDRASDCVIFVESLGAFDLHVVAGNASALR